MHYNPFFASLVATALSVAATLPVAAEASYLWQLGRPDNRGTEFAHAPAGFARFRQDGFHAVGSSNPQADWSYVHPGPHDIWAGAQPHTFAIVFGLKDRPEAGNGVLEVDLVDTQASAPPKLRIEINGHATEMDLPPGAGDASVQGHPAQGKEHRFSVPIPASHLRAGDNEILITTLTGSWLLYDSIGMIAPAGAALAPVGGRTVILSAEGARGLVKTDGKLRQPVNVVLRHFGPPSDATLTVGAGSPTALHLEAGTHTIEAFAEPVAEPTQLKVVLTAANSTKESTVNLKPVPPLTVYVLPHSHTDIGYTDIQSAIEKRQVDNLLAGMAEARRTASYPEGARFVWNVEVTWAADLFLQRLDDKQKAEFLEAVRAGQVVLNGMYLNQLTGLCRPEELLRLFRFATTLGKITGRPVDSAMISDVPGYTWGTVTAMSQAGIRYFSVAPNYFDRIGTILREWENKPFYWQGPDGHSKVLVWIPFWGYAMSHRYRTMSPQLVGDFLDGLHQRAYPYDIACVRWSGHGDNAVPDAAICDFVRDWNAKYTWPHFVISGTGEAFQAFEKKHGAKLPVVRGDWTPYWEDGAGSSALETGLNRASADRLAQAETLLAIQPKATYPAKDFEAAWNAVMLYSEHTWGAWCSISEPQRKETLEQWAVKKGYADEAVQRSTQLYQAATGGGPKAAAFEVVNTLSWPRGGPVVLTAAQSKTGDTVVDEAGRACPSQRLKSGELLFIASPVPPLAAKRFEVKPGTPQWNGPAAIAVGATLANAALKVRVNPATGGIDQLVAANHNFAQDNEPLNEYLYLPGDDLKDVKKAGPATVKIGEFGPLVASLIVESSAPGCRSLKRELRLMAGADFLEIDNLVDKERLVAKNYKTAAGKESLNFAFSFRVDDGQIVLDLPFGRMRPEADQMPSACKNWFTVGRWADVSNNDLGITWVTLDAPLVQVGGLTARLLESQTNPDVWRKTVEPTQSLYSWAMNNHWGTNYRAYQEGPTQFRFVLRPHGKRDLAESTRFATGFGFPLVAVAADSGPWSSQPLLEVSDPAVVVAALKPADAGKATFVRLFNAADETKRVTLSWPSRTPAAITVSDLTEDAGAPMTGPLEIPSLGLVTLRVEWK